MPEDPIPKAFLDAFSDDPVVIRSDLDLRANTRLTYAPHTIEETHKYLSEYFSGISEIDRPQFLRFIEDNSIPFLRIAQKGIKATDGLLPDEEIDPLTLEAGAKTKIILASMPDLPLTVPSRLYIPAASLRRRYFIRPIDTLERLGRVDEMIIQLRGILSGGANQEIRIEDNPSLIRTYGFFQAGTIIPGSI